MLRALAAPVVDEEQLFDDVSAARDPVEAGTLASLRATVFRSYGSYRATRPVASLQPLTVAADEAALLYSNYERLGRTALVAIRGRVLARTRRCALCNVGGAGTLDHHLPRRRFPEFAILTLNLVPACSRCNTKKGMRYRRSPGRPAFLHAYFDELPEEPFLVADVSADAGVAVRFRVERLPGMPPELFETVRSHFDRLDLATYYVDESMEYLREQLLAYYEHFAAGGAGAVREYLRQQADTCASDKGENYWKTALARALRGSDEFCAGGFRSIGPYAPVA